MFAKERMGFMPALCVAFVDELTEGERKEFEGLGSQDERAAMVLGHPFIAEKLAGLQLSDGKDNRRSVAAREEGNRHFSEGRYQAALNKYCVAVAFADQSGPDYSLALANRSACLQRVGRQGRGLEDIAAAERAGYPRDKLYKLAERRAQCLADLGQLTKARIELEKAAQMVQKGALTGAAKDKFVAGLSKQLKKMEGKEDREEEKEGEGREVMTTVADVNPLFPSLARGVEVRYTKDQGRFVVAQKLLPTGTVVLSEDPLGWALDVERSGTHCQHCLAQVAVIVPCPRCASVAFCSQACMEAGLALYHRHECGLSRLLAASALNNFCLMAVRAVARHTAAELVELRGRLEGAPDIQAGAGGVEEPYRGEDLRTGLDLVHHDHDLEPEERIHR